MPPRIRFLFVRPVFCLGLPSDSPSRETPLPSASTSPCRACRGLSPPSHPEAPPSGTAPVRRCAPCLAHRANQRAALAGLGGVDCHLSDTRLSHATNILALSKGLRESAGTKKPTPKGRFCCRRSDISCNRGAVRRGD